MLQRRRGQSLWLISFDVEKCIPTLPWWAIFGVMKRPMVPPHIIAFFRSFYDALRQKFRSGQVDGSDWSMANGLAQGFPAIPDLLNLLFEPFHLLAAAQGVGVPVTATFLVASWSFADGIALAFTSLAEVVILVQGYLDWCALLGLGKPSCGSRIRPVPLLSPFSCAMGP